MSNVDLVHDCQLDYYGKQLATCGSDRRIKIFDIVDGKQGQQTAELVGHDGPVWQVAWAHPEYGNVLASCSYDRQVFVWKEHGPGHWALVHKFLGHEGSVNSIAWAPKEHGLVLACASSDENISILSYHSGGQWSATMTKAHKTGVNAISWAPAKEGLRLVTGGCDNLVKLWTFDQEKWVEEPLQKEKAHLDWVRGVAWAPATGDEKTMIASCSQDKKVIIWSRPSAGGEWQLETIQMKDVVWSVSWSITGGILATAGGDNHVTLWKEDTFGKWNQVGSLAE